MFDATRSKFSDVQFEKMDLDAQSSQSYASEWGVNSIPRVVMLDGSGKVLSNATPSADAASFERLVKQFHKNYRTISIVTAGMSGGVNSAAAGCVQ